MTPLYEFDVVVGDRGDVLTSIALPLPVDKRDQVRLRRREVPSSVAVVGVAADPSTAASQVLRTYKKVEERIGNNRDFARRIGHKPEVVKAAWGKEGK